MDVSMTCWRSAGRAVPWTEALSAWKCARIVSCMRRLRPNGLGPTLPLCACLLRQDRGLRDRSQDRGTQRGVVPCRQLRWPPKETTAMFERRWVRYGLLGLLAGAAALWALWPDPITRANARRIVPGMSLA